MDRELVVSCLFLDGWVASGDKLAPDYCGQPATSKSVKLFGKPLCAYHEEQELRSTLEV